MCVYIFASMSPYVLHLSDSLAYLGSEGSMTTLLSETRGFCHASLPLTSRQNRLWP